VELTWDEPFAKGNDQIGMNHLLKGMTKSHIWWYLVG